MDTAVFGLSFPEVVAGLVALAFGGVDWVAPGGIVTALIRV